MWKSTLCPWRAQWCLWEVVFQVGFSSQLCIFLSKPVLPVHHSLPLAAGSSTTPGYRAVDFRWPSFSLHSGTLKLKIMVLNESTLALMYLGPMLGIVKFFVEQFLCQLCYIHLQSLCFIPEGQRFVLTKMTFFFKVIFKLKIKVLQVFVLLFPYWTSPPKKYFANQVFYVFHFFSVYIYVLNFYLFIYLF